MKDKIIAATLALCAVAIPATAKEKILVNSEVTTHIVMPENIKMVDLSTTKIIGNQCADNIVRIKPFIEADSVLTHYREGELMGTLTLIGERHLAQYDVVYTAAPSRAASIHRVPYAGLDSYINPEVSMPLSRKWHVTPGPYMAAVENTIRWCLKANGMKAIVNNIYSIGDYFFIDYSLQNSTKIAYDIAEVRVKLTDKKEVKATNSQTVELSPVYSLNLAKKFKKNYRNVLVLDKLTFPDEKVLRIEISENQISGRVITLTVEYDDILNADGFDSDILKICRSTIHPISTNNPAL